MRVSLRKPRPTEWETYSMSQTRNTTTKYKKGSSLLGFKIQYIKILKL